MPIYMHIDGIEGESQADDHHNDFDVFSFSWGETNVRGTGGGRESARVAMADFNVLKPSGKGSPALFLACANGRHLPAVQIVVTTENSDREERMQRYVLTDVIISSYQTAGDGSVRPTESLSLNFAKIEFTQWFFRPNGLAEAQTAFWDVRNNTGG
jgi:type VI secretion system secreted protein Hcp